MSGKPGSEILICPRWAESQRFPPANINVLHWFSSLVLPGLRPENGKGEGEGEETDGNVSVREISSAERGWRRKGSSRVFGENWPRDARLTFSQRLFRRLWWIISLLADLPIHLCLSLRHRYDFNNFKGKKVRNRAIAIEFFAIEIEIVERTKFREISKRRLRIDRSSIERASNSSPRITTTRGRKWV